MIKMDEGSRLVIESMHKENQELMKEIKELKIVNKLQSEQLILHNVSKSFTEQQMDDAYDYGYSDGLNGRAC
tara:strand:+ start:353 stop:568 length:216 start_codon:yes stop_codon:yes gene_type:complete